MNSQSDSLHDSESVESTESTGPARAPAAEPATATAPGQLGPDGQEKKRFYSWSFFLVGSLYFLGLLAAGALTHFLPVGDSPIYPKCTFRETTGLDCSGCGATRAVSALAHGDLVQAFAYNALLMLFLPVISWWFLHCLVYGLNGRNLWPRLSMKWMIVVPVAIVLYSVLRNLPWEPFTLLAPHDL